MGAGQARIRTPVQRLGDRKSTRLNSSHQIISYAVFCLKKKQKEEYHHHTTGLFRRTQKDESVSGLLQRGLSQLGSTTLRRPRRTTTGSRGVVRNDCAAH